jgi:MoaA/NifB/PqqE/SkfB family radical SAM enzyme
MQRFDVRLEITNYCNLKCPHCVRSRLGEKYKLNTKHVSLKTVKNWLPAYFLIDTVKVLYLSGAVGEPTLNPDCAEIVNYLSNYCQIQLDSNGSTNNEDWWKELGSSNIHCVFSPDSLLPNNNKYRINSNTDKVLSNMRAFISGGGKASWKYIPFKHNENELEEHKKLASELGAKFLFVQPAQFDEKKEGQPMVPSKYFPKSDRVETSNLENQTPEYYCELLGKLKNLIEINPDGVIYPCCYSGRCFFITYTNFFTNGDPKPKIYDEMLSKDVRYSAFVKDILPLIENQGGVKTFSLNHNTIDNILQTDFYKFSLKNSWKSGNEFCDKHCQSKRYIVSET